MLDYTVSANQFPFTAGRKPETAKNLSRLMLDPIQQRDALSDICAALQVACDLIANSVGKFYLRDIGDVRTMGRRLEPVRSYAWQQLEEINKGEAK